MKAISGKDVQRVARVINDWRNHERPFEDTVYWSKRFMNAEDVFEKCRPSGPIVLFRNERTDIDNQYENRFTSWSTRESNVVGFGWGKRRMVWATVPPSAVLVMFECFPASIDRDQMHEVILRPGKYNIQPFPGALQVMSQRIPAPPMSSQNESLIVGFVRSILAEEIGRNYHTLDSMPNTWEDFQDYDVECFPTETGAYTVDVSFQGKKLSPTARFPNETEAKHFARMVVDKHRVNAMNNK